MTLADCFALFVKFFFLLTPPFVMSAFLSVTKDNTIQEKKHAGDLDHIVDSDYQRCASLLRRIHF